MVTNNKSNNIVDLPIAIMGETPLQVARALVDYVKDKPLAHVICIVKDPTDSSITMGWSTMDSGDMSLLLRYANFKWERSTFEEFP